MFPWCGQTRDSATNAVLLVRTMANGEPEMSTRAMPPTAASAAGRGVGAKAVRALAAGPRAVGAEPGAVTRAEEAAPIGVHDVPLVRTDARQRDECGAARAYDGERRTGDVDEGDAADRGERRVLGHPQRRRRDRGRRRGAVDAGAGREKRARRE